MDDLGGFDGYTGRLEGTTSGSGSQTTFILYTMPKFTYYTQCKYISHTINDTKIVYISCTIQKKYAYYPQYKNTIYILYTVQRYYTYYKQCRYAIRVIFLLKYVL